MKKIILAIFIVVIPAFALPAKTELLNFGYNTYDNWPGSENRTLSSIGLSVIGSYNNHFYIQLNPYYGFVLEKNGTTDYETTHYLTDDENTTIAGFSTLLGVGHDFDFGIAGLIIGGGLFGDFTFMIRDGYLREENPDRYYLTAGLGIGVNFYIRMGKSFVINAGIMGAWNPLSYEMSKSHTRKRKTTFNEDQNQYSVNIGIGWSTR